MCFLRQLGRFVQKISKGMRSCDERFVGDVVLGVCHRRSVLLTEIGRAIEEDLDLDDTEKRLSRMAGTVHFADDVLEQNYLAAMAAHVNRLGYIAVDIGDIQKPHSVVLEHLCRVRDGSAKEEKTIGPGYWMVEVAATDAKNHHVLPLVTRVYSSEDPEFVSQNREVHEVMERVARVVAPEVIWLFDRGFDGENYIEKFVERMLRWIIRMRGDRIVEMGDHRVVMKDLASSLELKHTTTLHARTKGSRDVAYRARFSFIPVHLRGIEGTFGLVVVDAGRKERMMLLCWRIPKNEDEAARLIKAYLRRWGIEDDGRALKQLADIEDVRVQSLRGIRRLIQLATVALGWLCHVLLSCPVLAAQLLSRAKTVGKEPLYKAYRLMEGLRAGG